MQRRHQPNRFRSALANLSRRFPRQQKHHIDLSETPRMQAPPPPPAPPPDGYQDLDPCAPIPMDIVPNPEQPHHVFNAQPSSQIPNHPQPSIQPNPLNLPIVADPRQPLPVALQQHLFGDLTPLVQTNTPVMYQLLPPVTTLTPQHFAPQSPILHQQPIPTQLPISTQPPIHLQLPVPSQLSNLPLRPVSSQPSIPPHPQHPQHRPRPRQIRHPRAPHHHPRQTPSHSRITPTTTPHQLYQTPPASAAAHATAKQQRITRGSRRPSNHRRQPTSKLPKAPTLPIQPSLQQSIRRPSPRLRQRFIRVLNLAQAPASWYGSLSIQHPTHARFTTIPVAAFSYTLRTKQPFTASLPNVVKLTNDTVQEFDQVIDSAMSGAFMIRLSPINDYGQSVCNNIYSAFVTACLVSGYVHKVSIDGGDILLFPLTFPQVGLCFVGIFVSS